MACKGKRRCARIVRGANLSRSKDYGLFKELTLKFGLPDDE